MIKNKEFIECDRCLGMGWAIADRQIYPYEKVDKCYQCKGIGKIEVKNDI